MQIEHPTERLTRRFPVLSPQLQRAARFVLDHPAMVASRSMRAIAREAGVPHATMARLANEIGHRAFSELQQHYRDDLAPPAHSYAGKAQDWQQAAARSDQTLRASQRDVLAELHGATEPAAIDCAAKLLLAARKVTVAGLLSSFAFAHYLHYTARMMFDSWRLGGAGRSGLADEIADLGAQDALIAIALHPYARETVEAAKIAKAQGAKLVAITDHRTAPIAAMADQLLLVPTDGPQFFPSHVALTAIIEELVAVLAAKAGKQALDRLSRVEETRRSLQQYCA